MIYQYLMTAPFDLLCIYGVNIPMSSLTEQQGSGTFKLYYDMLNYQMKRKEIGDVES